MENVEEDLSRCASFWRSEGCNKDREIPLDFEQSGNFQLRKHRHNNLYAASQPDVYSFAPRAEGIQQAVPRLYGRTGAAVGPPSGHNRETRSSSPGEERDSRWPSRMPPLRERPPARVQCLPAGTEKSCQSENGFCEDFSRLCAAELNNPHCKISSACADPLV